MALITSPTETIPDLNYEYHTVTIDSIGQDSANTFTCFLQQPLKNVVQARLLAARISTTTDTEHCYVSIEELDSIFNDRASNVYEGQASMSMLRNSFASIVTDGVADIVFKDNYTIATQYIDPIRRIDRFTVTIRDQDAVTVPNGSGGTFLVLRFVCRKPNL
jgi:hypothetical protein|tara:strand:+ start:340 stop:825 length:486 start_codon:yes stop_codon:yes gene_type:complete